MPRLTKRKANMAEQYTQYRAAAYDNVLVSFSRPFDGIKDAQTDATILAEKGYYTDIVIIRELLDDQGLLTEEKIVKRVKGTEKPFIKGIEVRNSGRRNG